MMKYTFTILIAILSLTLGYGQDQKIAEKAEQKVEEINQLIISENPDLELTAEQKETLLQLHVQKLKDIRTINKSEATEDEKKKERKKIYKEVAKTTNNEILTADQRKAKNKARNKKK